MTVIRNSNATPIIIDDIQEIPAIIPMAVGQKYRRRDGSIATIIHHEPISQFFMCNSKWTYQCLMVSPDGWKIYSFEDSPEDLIELISAE